MCREGFKFVYQLVLVSPRVTRPRYRDTGGRVGVLPGNVTVVFLRGCPSGTPGRTWNSRSSLTRTTVRQG